MIFRYWTRLPDGRTVESHTKSFYGDWCYRVVWNPISEGPPTSTSAAKRDVAWSVSQEMEKRKS